ncbi:hypothetical protein [Paenibacillus sp. NPDC057967]
MENWRTSPVCSWRSCLW